MRQAWKTLAIPLLAACAAMGACASEEDENKRIDDWRRAVPGPSEVVSEPGTQLKWMRCPLGQKWNGSSCEGEALEVTWDQAISACPVGYRVPTRDEIARMLGGCDEEVTQGNRGFCAPCTKSAACSSMLGAGDSRMYWSSTVFMYYPTWSWYADFGDGNISNNGKAFTYFVRCVSGPVFRVAPPRLEPTPASSPQPSRRPAAEPREEE